jgi:predicted alpha/beta-hydrolase family hydrolase
MESSSVAQLEGTSAPVLILQGTRDCFLGLDVTVCEGQIVFDA